MKKILTSATVAALALPMLAGAAAITNVSDVGKFIIDTINNVLVPVLFAISFVVFLWGAFKTFILGASDDKKRADGKTQMLYALVGFFVMISIWGLVNILTNTANLGDVSGPSTGLPRAGGVGR
jgi:hypothetical protein